MSVVKKPLVSEKMTLLNERPGVKYNQYAFKVDINSDKPEIKKEIEDLYGVKVKSVRTMIYAGKLRTRYTRTGFLNGKSPRFKKAIVTLVPGETIDFYKNI
ncbi:MAG: 50S ribosomal protein L23 [Bacteroidia bacterium]